MSEKGDKTFQDRVAKARKKVKEDKKTATFEAKRDKNASSQAEATAKGDAYDKYATSLKPQIQEYESRLDYFANKVAKGDKLSVIDQKEIDDTTKKLKSIKAAYDKARQDAIDFYYNKTNTPASKASKPAASKPSAPAAASTPSTPATPAKPAKAKTSEKPASKTSTTDTASKVPVASAGATTRDPVTGKVIKVSDIKPANGKKTPKPPVGPVALDDSDEKKASGLAAAAAIDLAGTLFEHEPSLKALLDDYVKKGWSDNRFLQELRNNTWYKKNSAEIKTRYVQLYNYQDLVATGQADGTSDYEKQIDTLKNQIIKRANEMGSGYASDPAAVQRAAENMYITNTGIDDALTTKLIAAAIRPIGSTLGGKPTEGYSGKALQDYQAIQSIAKSNGFAVSDIIPGGYNERQVLENIATGAIDVNRIAQDARKLAAQGQPQYVRDLLGQGYNLDQVYAPYRQTMANILEVGDPNQIDLNDPTLRTAITEKGDMNLYDFKKALRQDNRWQYTEQAKQDVSNAALKVLRDFGFQG